MPTDGEALLAGLATWPTTEAEARLAELDWESRAWLAANWIAVGRLLDAEIAVLRAVEALPSSVVWKPTFDTD